jgi:hypothetical protein
MLTDQETPEMSEESPQESSPKETPTPPKENQPETPAEEESVPTDQSVAHEDPSSPAAQSPEVPPTPPATEVPEPPGPEVPVVAEAAAEGETASPPAAEAEAAPESPRTELETIPTPEGLEALNEAVEQRVHEILGQKGSSEQVLAQATISDLIHLLDKYILADNPLTQIPRVGLVKRSYDTLKYQEELPKPLEELFLNRLAAFNQLRISAEKRMEDVRGANLEKKKALLETLKSVVEAEDPQRIEEVRAIQEEWKRVGQVPKAQLDELYTNYRVLLDKFYELRGMHLELLDYDRKINLQEKERLIEEARVSLIPLEEEREDPDVWHDKMDMLSELQQQWKSVGHVPREEMDRVNSEYRAIVDHFFEIRQGFRDKLDELRQENADQKIAILAKMEEFREFEADRPRAWNDVNRTFREYQEAYKAIGQAPQSVNGELWAKYRDICNAFYGRKAEFFKKFDELRQENLEQKKALVERVEELAKGNEWERTAKELKRLQREWKNIGPVPERHSNKLWARFREACDAFFEARRLHYHALHAEEHENLDKKKALIDEVRKLIETPTENVPEMIEQVKGLQSQWRDIGKVPYKEKDKVWDEFRGEVDRFFNSLPAKRSEIREVRTKVSIESIEDLDDRSKAIKDRSQRLKHKISKARESVEQFLNNMDRIAKGKSGEPLRKQIQDEIDKEERLIDEWRKQVKELNQLLKNPPEPTPDPVAEAPQAEPATEPEDAVASSSAAPIAAVPESPAAEETPAPTEEVPAQEVETASPEAATSTAEAATEEETPTEEDATEEEATEEKKDA